MKNLIVIFTFCFTFSGCLFAQTGSLEVYNFKYRTYNNSNSWNWLGLTYYFNKKRNIDFGIGLGYNVTPIFIKETLFYSSHPRNKNQLNNINLNCTVRAHFNINKENVDIYLFNKFNIGRTSFYQTSIIFQDSSNFIYKNTFSNPRILLDNTIGIGLDVKVFKDLHFFTKFGVCFWYTKGNNFQMESIRTSKEFGLRYNLK